MVVRLKLLVQDADSVPQLRVSNILEAVESLLVSIERFVNIVREKVAVANSCPRWSILRVDLCHLEIILDRAHIVTFSSVVLSHS